MTLFGLPLNLDDLLAAGAAATAFTIMLAIWDTLLLRDPVGARLRGLAERRNQMRASHVAPAGHGFRGRLRHSGWSLVRNLVASFRLMRGRRVERIQTLLSRAGWRSQDALVLYVFAATVTPVLIGGGGVLFFGLSRWAPPNPTLRWAMIVICLAVGFYGVRLWVKNIGDKRVHEMTKALPDALDLLVICAEAGLSLDMAITRVAQDLARAAPDLSDEFAMTALELGFVPDRQVALHNLVKRTDMQNLRGLVNSLAHCERYGTPVADALRVLAAEFRDERMMRAEEKAAKLPAKMTVPMILFILPTQFMVIGGPAIIRIIDTMLHR